MMKKLGILVAAAALLVVMTGGNALADVPFANKLSSGIIDDDSMGGGYNGIWITHKQETISVPANNYVTEECHWYCFSERITPGQCDAIYQVVCNGGIPDTYVWNSHSGAVPSTYSLNYTYNERVQVGATTGNYTYNVVECYYPWGSGYIYNPNPMLANTIRIT